VGTGDVTCHLALQCRPVQPGGDAAIVLLDQPERGIEQGADVGVVEDLEPYLSAFVGQLVARVTTGVPEETVVVVIGTGSSGDNDCHPSAGAQSPPELSERATVVCHVLEQIGADDRIQAIVENRQITAIGLDQQRRRHQTVGLAQARADQIHADQGGVGTLHTHILEQVARRAADVGDRRVAGQWPDALQDRAAGPPVQEMRTRRLLVKLLELIGPVDRRVLLHIGEIRRRAWFPETPPVRERRDFGSAWWGAKDRRGLGRVGPRRASRWELRRHVQSVDERLRSRPLIAATDTIPQPTCRICEGRTEHLGVVHGDYSDRFYELRRCRDCRYAFIANPWTDFAQIYDDRYYAGQGADPLVDYQFELDSPAETIRVYEWRGIARVVEQSLGGLEGVRWLDFGAGNGGLVRYARDHTRAEPVGFEEGSIAEQARRRGIPVRSTLDSEQDGSFDVVTAIEVLEHTLDPLVELRRIRGLLRLGGLLLLTTGNAAPFASRLTRWPYVIPEIHVSFFEPATLARALQATGFRPTAIPAAGGFDEVLKFKVLKNLRVRKRSRITDAIPARPVAVVADARTRLRAHPIAWAV
jgi:SAM-dependent methyltransferase